MPSIYNHENACWGIKKSSCDMFQYDFNEEFQTNKPREHGYPTHESNATPNTAYVQYSVSSNGYYGYQPHKVSQVQSNIGDDDIEMEVEDIGATPNTSQTNDSTSILACAALNPNLQCFGVRRKRQMPNDSLDSSKRIRQCDSEEQVKSPMQESHQCGGGGGWSKRCRRIRPSKVDLSGVDHDTAATELLRQTHGCELYLFERTCDY